MLLMAICAQIVIGRLWRAGNSRITTTTAHFTLAPFWVFLWTRLALGVRWYLLFYQGSKATCVGRTISGPVAVVQGPLQSAEAQSSLHAQAGLSRGHAIPIQLWWKRSDVGKQNSLYYITPFCCFVAHQGTKGSWKKFTSNLNNAASSANHRLLDESVCKALGCPKALSLPTGECSVFRHELSKSDDIADRDSYHHHSAC